MGHLVRSRILLAGVVAVLGAAATVSSLARAGGSAPLPPDLITLAVQADDLVIAVEKKRTLLRLSNEVVNQGAGPLEVFPSIASSNCDGDGDPANDRDASQRLFADTNASGAFEPALDAIASERRVGCMRYHPAHDHWHVLDFAKYQLRREPSGKLAAVTRKVGFCLGDNRRYFIDSTPPLGKVYPFGPPGSVGCDSAATQGISVGWADDYPFYLPGQQLKISNLDRGRYCLISRADPFDHLEEADETNNVRRTRISLRPRGLAVKKLAGRCRI